MLRPGLVIIVEWIAFAASWLLAAPWSSAVEKRAGLRRELAYRTLQITGAVLLGIPAHGYRRPLRLWFVSRTVAWACVTIIVGGFGFAWWARLHLGALWSMQVTAKKNHRVIDSGPYAIVRHPIYTGIPAAVIATAAAKGTIPGLAGLLLLVLAVWMKARLEETWLAAELEAGAYEQYRHRVPMLIPFAPVAR